MKKSKVTKYLEIHGGWISFVLVLIVMIMAVAARGEPKPERVILPVQMISDNSMTTLSLFNGRLLKVELRLAKVERNQAREGDFVCDVEIPGAGLVNCRQCRWKLDEQGREIQ